MPVICAGCGQSWPRDPAIEVAWPKCQAPAGSRCKRPSGHECDVHVERDGLALAQGVMQPCPAIRTRPLAEPKPRRPTMRCEAPDLPLFAAAGEPAGRP